MADVSPLQRIDEMTIRADVFSIAHRSRDTSCMHYIMYTVPEKG